MTKRQIASQLRKAAKVMRVGGYARGTAGDTSQTTTPHCMIGALETLDRAFYSPVHPVPVALADVLRSRAKGVIDTQNFTAAIDDSSDAVDVICAFNNEVVYAARKTDAGRAEYAARTFERVADKLAPRG